MTATSTAPALDDLAAVLRGRLVLPEDVDYEPARAVYNAMIDVRPQAIAQVADIADVITVVNFARDAGLDLAIRGGAHNGAGLGTSDGVVIDLAAMNGVRIDPGRSVALVEGGATLGDLDHAAHAFGLATPAGIISTTGVGGLTLGGGLGHLTRKYGLTIDNLVAADVVLADGSVVTADARSEPDLFWALRGGGGNFGVVTAFQFAMHPVREVMAGPMLWLLDQADEVLSWYRDFIVDAPQDLNGFFAFLTVPPAPPFPEELQLQKVCGVVWCWVGLPAQLDSVLEPARALQPVLDGVMPMPYPALNSAFDAIFPPGQQWYWRSDMVRDVPDAAIERHLEFAAQMPSWQSTMHLYPVDGAVHRVPGDATAWAYRDATWDQVIVGVDPDPANAAAMRDWTVDYHEALHEFSLGGGYVNMMMDEGEDRVRASYRGNYDRLTEVKAMYDPGNLFRRNQNIRPASGSGIPAARAPSGMSKPVGAPHHW